MTRLPAPLPEWLLAELPPTARLAATLTGDSSTAAQLIAESLARDSSWRALDPTVDPAQRCASRS